MREYDSYYLDRYGKRWSLLVGIESEKDVKKWCRQNWMRANSKKTRKQIFYACKLSAYFRHAGKKERPPPYCQFRAHFNRISSRMYTIGEHNHSLDLDNVDGTEGENERKMQFIVVNNNSSRIKSIVMILILNYRVDC